MMRNKKAATGEAVITIYRVMFVTMIAFVVLGTSSVIYSYSVKSEDTESMLLGRVVLDCLTKDGKVDLEKFNLEKDNFMRKCNIVYPQDFAFVSLKFFDENEKVVGYGIYGEEGLEWIKGLYESKVKTESIKEYQPGYFNTKFPITFLNEGKDVKGSILLEVIINAK